MTSPTGTPAATPTAATADAAPPTPAVGGPISPLDGSQAGDRSLRRCVGDVRRFLASDWTRRPHLHRGAGFDDLLSLDDVDSIVATSGLRTPAFRLVRAGQTLATSTYTRSARIGSRPVSDLIDVGRVHALFADGATIVLQGLHRYWPPLTRFCRDLELSLTQPVQANAYITPPTSSGLRVHHDAHDVFALQTYGRKQWVAYEPGIDEGDPPATPSLDVQLVSGDALYMPRGAPHAARTVDAASVHVTIGVRSDTWRDLLRRVLDEAVDDAALDEALPVGYANDPEALAPAVAARLADLSRRLAARQAGAVAAAAAERFWSGRTPLLTGQLPQLLALDSIGDATRLARRAGSVCRLTGGDGRVTASLGDRRLHLPARIGPAMTWICEQPRFAVGDLAAFLDADGRRVLARRLVREGLLVVVE